MLAKARAHHSLPPPAERRRIREAAGLSQSDVALALGVSSPTVWRWEQEPGFSPRSHRVLAEYAYLLEQLKAQVSQ